MKTYIKPSICEVELFTKDAISLSIPKTTYKRSASGFTRDQLIAMALENQSIVNSLK